MVRPIDQLYRILAESGGHLTHSIEVRGGIGISSLSMETR